jgi:hypothetical protein
MNRVTFFSKNNLDQPWKTGRMVNFVAEERIRAEN